MVNSCTVLFEVFEENADSTEHTRTVRYPHITPSLLGRPLRDPHHGVQFGRLSEQSTTTGYEPNDPIKVSSTEVTPMLLP